MVLNALRESILGAVEYWRSPELGNRWGGPFNGQQVRAALFQSLIAKIHARAIVETGTYRGATTEFMAQTGLPIFTIESHARSYGFARARLFRHRNVFVRRGDSRIVLRQLFRGPLRKFTDQTVFWYLDAHWNDELPLAEEIDLVFNHYPAAAVMIDDFQVPFDADYAYDNYGADKALTSAYVEAALRTHTLQAFYPSVPASNETGMRRGCVVLAKRTFHAGVLEGMAELRSFDWSTDDVHPAYRSTVRMRGKRM
jgi:hypothetical protein